MDSRALSYQIKRAGRKKEKERERE